MDLYSIEKTKDYTFFKFISWYYQLTPRIIKLIKIIILILILTAFFALNHFTKDKITLYIYSIVAVNSIVLLYLMEVLIQLLAKGTGNEKMIEMSNSIKECMDAFLKMIFRSLFKLIMISILLYVILLLCFNYSYQKNINDLLGRPFLFLFNILLFVFGCLITSLIYYFSLWLSSIGIIRASSHILKCYNEYSKFVYKISFTLSIFAITLNITFFGTFFLLTYFLMFISDEGYFSYPYEKIGFMMIPYFFGIGIVNLYIGLVGNIYVKTANNCFDLKDKIEVNFQTDFKNPIYISAMSGENIKNCITVINNNTLLLCGVIIVMFIASSISDKATSIMKDNNIKTKIFIFPLLIYTVDLLLEVLRIFFINTQPGLPKGGTDYQEIENIITVFSKKGCLFGIFKVIAFSLISFFIFSNSRNIYDLQNDIFWINCILCYFIGEINFYLIQYFTKKYTDKASSPIKYLLSLTQSGYLDNLLGGTLNGIESSLFPCILIAISLIGGYNLGIKLNYYLNFEYIKKQIGYFFVLIIMLSLHLEIIFLNTTQQAKTVLYLTDEIIKTTATEVSIQNITEVCYKQCESYQYSIKGIITAIEFYTLFLLINSIEYIYTNLSSHELKIDLSQSENYISCLFGILLIHCLISSLIEINIKTTQIGIKSLSTIFKSAADTTNIVEKTQLDYRHCVWAITQVSIRSIFKITSIIICSQIAIFFSFKFIGSFFQYNSSLGIQSLISFISFALGYSLISELFMNNTGVSLINTHKMVLEGSSGSTFDDIEKYTKFGNEIGKYSESYIGGCISTIVIFIVIEAMFLLPFYI